MVSFCCCHICIRWKPGTRQWLANRYRLDENASPPEMVLRPITALLPEFFNLLVPTLADRDQKLWWFEMTKMQELLWTANRRLNQASLKFKLNVNTHQVLPSGRGDLRDRPAVS